MAEVFHSNPTPWVDEEPTIWEPDQPYDRFRVGGWIRDLTDDGDVESNPGPWGDDGPSYSSDSETEEEEIDDFWDEEPGGPGFIPEPGFPGMIAGQIVGGQIIWFN
jgi:hypothetical protein